MNVEELIEKAKKENADSLDLSNEGLKKIPSSAPVKIRS